MAETPAKRVLDFTNVKDSSGINPTHVPLGDYKLKIVSVTEGNSKANNPQWVFVLQSLTLKSATYPYYCTLEEKSLWKLRNLLLAAGLNVPKKRVNVDPARLVNKEIGATLEPEEYEGKWKSIVTAVFPADEVTESPTTPGDAGAEDDLAEGDEVVEEEMEELDVEDL